MEQVSLHNKPHGNVSKKYDNNYNNQCQQGAQADDGVGQGAAVDCARAGTTRGGCWEKRRRVCSRVALAASKQAAAAAAAAAAVATNHNLTSGRAHRTPKSESAAGGRTMEGFGRLCSNTSTTVMIVANERTEATALVASLPSGNKTVAQPTCRRLLDVNPRDTPAQLSWPTLMGLVIVIVLGAISYNESFVSAAYLATSYEDVGRPYLDSRCESRRKDASSNEAARILLMLKCDLKPLYEQYVGAYGVDKAKLMGGKPRIGRDLARLAQVVDDFADEGFTLLAVTDFCTYHTVSRLAKLKDKAAESNLLSIAYDIIAIEFHRSCLKEIISKLPPVPRLVRDVINIYMEGVDRKLVRSTKSRGTSLAMDDFDDVAPFDVEAAIRRNGRLEHIVGLLLTMPFGEPKSDEEIADDFRKQCREFLVEIERRWDTGEMMSSMLNTDGNAIKSVNNYVMRTLTPTKFADICSQLSEPSRG